MLEPSPPDICSSDWITIFVYQRPSGQAYALIAGGILRDGECLPRWINIIRHQVSEKHIHTRARARAYSYTERCTDTEIDREGERVI